MAKTVFRSPHKIILAGEHAVVYGSSAITISMDKYKTAEICAIDEDIFRIVQPDQTFLQIYPNSILENMDIEIYKSKKDVFGMIFYELFTVRKLRFERAYGCEISITSDLPPVGGFGGSTALIACVVGGLNDFFGWRLDFEQLLEIVIVCESYLQGYRSSGMEQIAALVPGMLYFDKTQTGLKFEKIKNQCLQRILVVNTGKSQNTTGEMVAYVRDHLDTNGEFIQKISETVPNIKTALEAGDFWGICSNLDVISQNLVSMGVVTEVVQKIIADIRALGGVAKISGAGARDGSGAGALLVLSRDFASIEKYLQAEGLEFFYANLTSSPTLMPSV